MNKTMNHQIDPTRDLVMDRTVDVPRELVWKAWTEPEHLMKWFCPKPWETTECEVDLRPGGIFRTVLRGPEGQSSANIGCYLEIVPNEKLVWTMALGPGYRPWTRPVNGPELAFTAVITMEAQGSGTKYRALVIHGDPESRNKHDEMGFSQGWGAAFDQMVAMIKGM